MTKKLKTVYRASGPDGTETEYAVRRPGPKEISDGLKVYNRAFREAIDSDAIVRAKLDAVLRKQNLWDDDKQAEADLLNADIVEHERLLGRKYRVGEDGKRTNLKLSEARDVAVNLRRLRADLQALYRDRNSLEGLTAESQADNARFNYFVSACLVYNQTGERVFRSVDDYLEHAAEPHAFLGAGHLAAMLVGGDDPDWQRKLPENQFLARYGFVDDKLRLIDPQTKHLIDADGRRIDENGRYVNEQGQFVNRGGDRVDEDGNLVFEDAQAFEDDMGLTAAGRPGEDAAAEEPAVAS